MATIIESPVKGTVVEVHVGIGDEVVEKQHLITIELGKTLITIRATIAGKITSLFVKPGDQVQRDAAAVTIG